MLSPKLTIPPGQIARFAGQIAAVSARVEAAHERWLHTWAEKIVGDAKKALMGGEGYPKRIDDGTLRASVHPVFESDELAAYVISELAYAVHVHFGTGKYSEDGKGRKTPWVYFDEKRQQFFVTEGMPANPFLRRAFDKNEKRALRDFVRMHNAALRGAAR